jgi:hypothetical protein
MYFKIIYVKEINVRNIITILFGLFSLINLGAQEVVGNPIYEFATGKYSMLYSPVNIRSHPNLTGSVVGRLELHSEIEILENTKNSQIIDGMTHYWYKIQYGNITGYIWGGYISIRAFSFNNYGNNIKCYYRVSNRKKFETGTSNGIQYSHYFDSILPNDIFIYINNRRVLVNEIHGAPPSVAAQMDIRL